MMRPLHIRSKRPKLTEAEAWIRGDLLWVTGPEDYLSEKERQQEIAKTVESLQAISRKHFPRTRVLEYAVLKAHLIVEHALTEFIRCSATSLTPLEKIRFSFTQKVEIGCLMGLAEDPTLVPCIELLNQARNQVAHRFLLDRPLVDRLLCLIAKEHNLKLETDVERIRWLRAFCAFFCGRIAGHLEVAIDLSARRHKRQPNTTLKPTSGARASKAKRVGTERRSRLSV